MKDNILQSIEIKQIAPSKTNPRKRFDEKALKELAESIKVHGVLSPIIIRPAGEKDKYELVAGERRFRAAKQASLTEIPAIVRELTDNQALEIQVIENLQRDDLHPIEEAEGYEALIQTHGYKTAEEICAKIGKSRSYVYGRMKLCALTEKNRQLFYDGKLNASTALLIARIPEALQEKAAKEITDHYSGYGDEPQPMSYRDALEHIHDNYTLSLEKAPFDTKDATLCPSAGACTTCPKRSGNEKDLFGDIKRADVCTDPVCFKTKKDTAWQNQTADLAEKGAKVLEADKCEKLFYGDQLNSCRHVLLHGKCEEDPKKRTFAQLFAKAPNPNFNPNIDPREIIVARDEKGKVRQLLTRGTAYKLLADAGYKFAEKMQSRTNQNDSSPRYGSKEYEALELEKKKKRDRMEKILQAAFDEALPKIVQHAEKNSVEVLREYVSQEFNQWQAKKIGTRRGIKDLDASVKMMSLAQLVGLLVEIKQDNPFNGYSGEFEAGFIIHAKLAGVDLKALKQKHVEKIDQETKVAEKPKEDKSQDKKEGKELAEKGPKKAVKKYKLNATKKGGSK